MHFLKKKKKKTCVKQRAESNIITTNATTEAANARAEGDTWNYAIHTARQHRRGLTRFPKRSPLAAQRSQLL
jgi:hypothetical protein